MATFLTGGTGFVGRYLLQGMLERGEEVVALVRCGSRDEGVERIREALAFVGATHRDEAGLSVCPGDLTEPDLGLAADERERVLATCDRFLHCGANVRFDLTLEQARVINVTGTAGVLELARQRQRAGALERVDIVSTAYVAGWQEGIVYEAEPPADAEHKNSYERSKFEAEKLAWRAAEELPVCIFRPSIVVGEATTGRTPSFQGGYILAGIYARGLWRTLPARADSMIDVVPVDFLRDAILEIRRQPTSVGGCFHVAAGPDGDATLGEVLGVLEQYFPHRKPVRLVDPEWWARWVQPLLRLVRLGRLGQVAALFDAIHPYGIANPRFDTTNTRQALAGTGVQLPDVRQYGYGLLEFAVATEWGRKHLGA